MRGPARRARLQRDRASVVTDPRPRPCWSLLLQIQDALDHELAVRRWNGNSTTMAAVKKETKRDDKRPPRRVRAELPADAKRPAIVEALGRVLGQK